MLRLHNSYGPLVFISRFYENDARL